jgi:D-arabinose 1-dehydrogenase-like Zn-dependent alcohol dehydrogenase
MGTYAEYISLWAKSLVVLPEEVSDDDVPLACGGLTAYSAVKKLLKFGVLPGKPIAIVGAAGGLGHYAVQIAKAFGYIVIGVDVGQERIEFIQEMGADLAVDVAEARTAVKQKFIGAYGSIVFASKISGFELGLQLMRKAGIFISVGMPAGRLLWAMSKKCENWCNWPQKVKSRPTSAAEQNYRKSIRSWMSWRTRNTLEGPLSRICQAREADAK